MKNAETRETLNKHQARTEATLRGVLKAAGEVFVRDGYERAQIETIACQAGRTKGAIYNHFRSKEDIFFALLEQKAVERRAAFVRSAKDASSRSQVEALKKLFLDSMEEDHWPILMLEFKLFALRNKSSKRRVRKLSQLLHEDIDRKFFPKLGIVGKREKQRAAVGVAVLRALPSAIVLERQFNSVLDDAGVARQVFGGVFDSLFEVEEELKTARRKRAAQASTRP
jgi:AcrR family transcriptional regulator